MKHALLDNNWDGRKDLNKNRISHKDWKVYENLDPEAQHLFENLKNKIKQTDIVN